ncbi:MAG: discoidin domain-containing protein [bacterium]
MSSFIPRFFLCLTVLLLMNVDAKAQTKSVQEGQFGRIVVTTSSTLAHQAGNSYSPINAIDGNGRTAWVEGAAGDGIGEWIKVSYDSPMPIDGIYFNNGYGKTAKSYSENGRVREAEIATENGSFVKTLLDKKEEIQIRLPANMAGKKTRWVKLTIKSVYPGTKYKDTAIGEFRPNLEEHNYSNESDN